VRDLKFDDLTRTIPNWSMPVGVSTLALMLAVCQNKANEQTA